MLVVVNLPALGPKNELLLPMVLDKPALTPKKALLMPVVLFWPAPPPAKRLFSPAMLKTRLPPMLYWVLLMPPLTSSNDCGLLVPMPTLPFDFIRIRSVAVDNPLVANRMSLAVCVQITVST